MNAALAKAKQDKQDEFYTQLDDIANELKHYKEHFAGKIVLCNCDDPYESNFFKYFALVFNEWKIKKLICTCWDGSPIAQQDLVLFDDEKKDEDGRSRIAYKIELTEVKDLNGDGATDLEDVRLLLEENRPQRLEGHGDFRSPECLDLLKEADIVVTNPPFSLFREYVSLLMLYEKRFLIIGNQNAISYKEIFPLIKDNKVWLGVKAGDMAFRVPDYYEERDTRFWIDEDNKKWRSMGNICWFTNLDHKKRHRMLDLYKNYSSSEYPHYDNYDAINVEKVDRIPMDYDGVMGVPLTFLDKYNPDQFEILGLTSGRNEFDKSAWPTKRYLNPLQINRDGSTTNGSKANTRATILLDKVPSNAIYYTADNADRPFEIVYARILIRKKI
ncbi:MAG: adenine-specific methyltransferase EcoRI family protein [Bacteroidales bacterium]|nr:adenine-specific methyltransferase EcoRI family protein [Bacteroidales bacterium]